MSLFFEDDDENDMSAVNKINTAVRNSKKRALVIPKKQWTLDTACTALVTLMHNDDDVFLMGKLQTQAPRLRDDMQRLLWEEECTQWDMYQACMVSLLVELASKFGTGFLQESFVPCIANCSGSGRHVLLNELLLSSNFMDENQDEALVILNLPYVLMSALSSRQEERPAWKRPWRKNRQGVHTEWMVPLAYLLTHAVCHASSDQKNLDWSKQVMTAVMELLTKSFPTLLLSDFQAGLALYALQCLMDTSKARELIPGMGFHDGRVVALDGLHPQDLVDLLLVPNVLHLLQSAVGAPRYPLVAKFVEIVLHFSYQHDAREQEKMAHAALHLLIKGNNLKLGAFAYLESLVQKSTGRETQMTLHRKRKSSDSDGMMIVPFNENDVGLKKDLMSPGFPLLVEVELNCCLGRKEQAIEIADRMEQTPGILTTQDQCKAWFFILEFLKCNSLLFLDGNANQTKIYQEKRCLLLSIVSCMGNLGRDVLLEYYQQIVQEVTNASSSTPDEVMYVTIAAQQTVLRLMMAKYGAAGGIGYLRETFPSASLWLGDLKRWALGFLRKAPAVPFSLNEDGHANIAVLLDRAGQENEPVEENVSAIQPITPQVDTIVAEPTPPESEPEQNSTDDEVVILDSSDEGIVPEAPSEQFTQEGSDDVTIREDDETADPQQVHDLFNDGSEEEQANDALETLHEETEEEEEDYIGEIDEYDEDEAHLEVIDELEHATSDEEVEAVVVDEDEEEEHTSHEEEGHEQDAAYPYAEEERVGDEKGYEPDTGCGFTEEEEEEAVHSEEDEEEEEESDGEHLTPLVRPTARAPYSENDMDEADEYTASEMEVHDEESSAVDGTSALLALANASIPQVGEAGAASNPEMPPPTTGSPRRFSDQEEDEGKAPGSDSEELSPVATIVNKVPDEDAAYQEGNTSASVAPSSVDMSDTETTPIVSKVPIESERETKILDDTTNAATAASDVIAYLSEYAEDVSAKEETAAESEFLPEDVEGKQEAEVASSAMWSRASLHVHGEDSPKEDMDIDTSEPSHSQTDDRKVNDESIQVNEAKVEEDQNESPNARVAEEWFGRNETDAVEITEDLSKDAVQSGLAQENSEKNDEEGVDEQREAGFFEADSEVADAVFHATSSRPIVNQSEAAEVETNTSRNRDEESVVNASPLLGEQTIGSHRDEQLVRDSSDDRVDMLNLLETGEKKRVGDSPSHVSTGTAGSEAASQERPTLSFETVLSPEIAGPSTAPDDDGNEDTVRNRSSPSLPGEINQSQSEFGSPTKHNRSHDQDALADEDTIETRARRSPTDKESQKEKAFDSPAMHTRSHDPEAEDRVVHGSSVAGSPTQSENQENAVFGSPAKHTRSHDPKVEDKVAPEGGVGGSPTQSETQQEEIFGSPAKHTRSHDVHAEKKSPAGSESRSQTPTSTDTIPSPSPTQSPQELSAAAASATTHALSDDREVGKLGDSVASTTHTPQIKTSETPAQRSKSHDNPHSPDNNDVGVLSTDQNDEDVPSTHTRSHDKKGAHAEYDGTPSKLSHNTSDESSISPQGKSIDIPEESPALSSIVSSVESSVASKRRTRTPVASIDTVEDTLPTVDEESSQQPGNSTTSGTNRRKSKSKRSEASVSTRRSTRLSSREARGSKPSMPSSAARRKHDLEEIQEDEIKLSGIATRRTTRRRAAASQEKAVEEGNNDVRKSPRRRSTRRTEDASASNVEDPSPKKRKKTSTASRSTRSTPRRTSARKTRRTTSQAAESKEDTATKTKAKTVNKSKIIEDDEDITVESKPASRRSPSRRRKTKAPESDEEEPSPKTRKVDRSKAKGTGDGESKKTAAASTKGRKTRTNTSKKDSTDISISSVASTRRSARLSKKSRR